MTRSRATTSSLALTATIYWFINEGADSHIGGFYERPTTQTYQKVVASDVIGSDPALQAGQEYLAAGGTYFEYLDITRGKFGVWGNHLYLGIELYGDRKIDGTDAGNAEEDFGEGTYYRVHMSSQADHRGGVMISAQNPKDLPSQFTAEETSAFLDAEFGLPAGEDYDVEIVDDGELQEGSERVVLQARRTTSDDDRPLVEFKFDYVEFNEQYPDHAIDPGWLHLIYEASRGLQSNYRWYRKIVSTSSATLSGASTAGRRGVETEPRIRMRPRQRAKAAGQPRLPDPYRHRATPRLYRSSCP